MRDIDLFQAALGLSPPFAVERCELDVEAKRLDLWVDFPRGSRFACSGCGKSGCAVHDSSEQTWRHLDFFQYKAFLHCRVPRSLCADCGVLKVKVPWARSGSGFTLLFEAMLVAMVKHMPVGVVARMVGEHDTRVWRVLDHYVGKALDGLDLSQLRQIGVDETSARRGHDYVSLFVDLAQRRVVFAGDGKGAETVEEFGAWLEDHGGARDKISDVPMDMSAAFVSGVGKTFPKAKITFDKFHVIQLVNRAVDEVRRQERKGFGADSHTRSGRNGAGRGPDALRSRRAFHAIPHQLLSRLTGSDTLHGINLHFERVCFNVCIVRRHAPRSSGNPSGNGAAATGQAVLHQF
jgi:transposase